MGCPLCKLKTRSFLISKPINEIVEGWKLSYGIDISNEFEMVSEDVVRLFQCDSCNLRYYEPAAAGTSMLYSRLQDLPGYYAKARWEFEQVLKMLREDDSVLEVGCGEGIFLSYIREKGVLNSTGIDTNKKAVSLAKDKGLKVECRTINNQANVGQLFDVICSFQVLEHIPDVYSFISDCVSLLKPNGRLIFSVPNEKSYIGKVENHWLNWPPHHLTRWESIVFKRFPSLWQVTLEAVYYEPLSQDNFNWYLNTKLARVAKIPILAGVCYRLALKIFQPFVLKMGALSLFRDQNLLVVLKSNQSPPI